MFFEGGERNRGLISWSLALRIASFWQTADDYQTQHIFGFDKQFADAGRLCPLVRRRRPETAQISHLPRDYRINEPERVFNLSVNVNTEIHNANCAVKNCQRV